MRPPLRPPLDDDALPAPANVERQPARPGDAPPAAAQPPVGVAPSQSGDSGHPTDLLDILDPVPPVETIDNPFGLSPREFLFVEAYFGAAHFHAAKAYELAGYKTTGATSRANASRMLTRDRVTKAVAARMAARAKALGIMDGDEALLGLSNLGRSDIRKVVDKNHPLAKLPDEVADWIKSVRPTKHGYVIEFYDKMHARELMAKVSGKLKDTVKVEHTLEDILGRANELEAGGGA